MSLLQTTRKQLRDETCNLSVRLRNQNITCSTYCDLRNTNSETKRSYDEIIDLIYIFCFKMITYNVKVITYNFNIIIFYNLKVITHNFKTITYNLKVLK